MSKREGQAFTLVELLAAVAMVALLVTLLVPRLTRARSIARAAICAGNPHQLDAAFKAARSGTEGMATPYAGPGA